MRNWIQNTELAEIILENLIAFPLTTLDLLSATTFSKKETLRNLHRLEAHPEESPSRKIIKYVKNKRRDYMKYHTFLGRLKKQGLVTQTGSLKSKRWSLTVAGKRVLEKLKVHAELINKATTPGGITMISYDIPERIHAERDSMRELLKLFGFVNVHQSLWYANVTVKKQFLDYLRERKLIDYVHIFEVSKTGTLTTIK